MENLNMAVKFTRILAAVAVMTLSCGVPVLAQDADRTTAFTIEEIFGSRPVIDAVLNGQPFRMIVHSNAGSYVQINHAEAERLNVGDRVHQGAYGISAPGQVNALGRDDGVLKSLIVAGNTRADVPVAIFERVSARSEGMLGLGWLSDNRVIIDYARNQVVLPRDPAEGERYGDALKAQGYTAHAIQRDPTDGRYLLTATIRGERLTFVVSTVAGNVLDIAAVDHAGLALGPVSGRWGGPGGAVGKTWAVAGPVTLQVDDWISPPIRFSAYDTYAYSQKPRPYLAAAGRAGDLGADFLIANRAVVDFGQGLIYLKPGS